MTVREMVLHLPVLAHVLQRIFGFSQSTVDKNIEIFWGVNSIHRREIISSSFSHAQASTREKNEAHSRARDMNGFPCDVLFGLFLCLWPAAAPLFASVFCFDLPTATPITTEALARPPAHTELRPRLASALTEH